MLLYYLLVLISILSLQSTAYSSRFFNIITNAPFIQLIYSLDITWSSITFLSSYIQKFSYLLFPLYLYYFQYSLVSVYNQSVRKYLFITALLQSLVCYSVNLVRIPRSSSYSSLSNYLTLSVPTLSLFITFYIGTLSFIRPSIANLQSSFCSYYIIIYCLNLSMLSFSFHLLKGFLKSLYFLITILTF